MPHNKSLSYDFGLFRFDVSLRVLTKAGEVISLGDKAAEVLLFLLHNAGNLVGKEDLMKEVWPDSFVEDSNLTQNIHTLRRVLGDDRVSARYIETVPRRGYRFVAEVRKSETGSHFSRTNEDVEAGDGQVGPPPKLGVLPFVNATGSDGFEYLAEGISENIINNLSRISKLRVMSRSFMFRYKGTAIEAKKIAFEMKLDAMLVGKIISRPSGMTISAELVDGNGFMLWGDSFDCELKDILEIQDEIARQISAALRLKLTGEEEKRITTRYTENSEAYQAYMEARFHWSRYTRTEIEQAIEHFRAAIELDPNYALAYSGIVDCYLRLATNYLPPEHYIRACGQLNLDEEASNVSEQNLQASQHLQADSWVRKVDLRHEWDWKGAERESRRASELKKNYPTAHQWHAAYLISRRLWQASMPQAVTSLLGSDRKDLTARIPSINLTAAEDVQVFCTIAREQIDSGNYEAACLVLSRWWSLGDLPKLAGLPSESCADLLFTAGELAGFVASAKQIPMGQKSGEMLLSGAVAFFEQLGSAGRSAEARIGLAMCYYRQGNFDLARSVLLSVLENLQAEEIELRSLVLIRLACLERHSGRSHDALKRLDEAQYFVEASGPWATGRHHLELGSTYKDLAIAEGDHSLFDRSLTQHLLALYEFEAIGNLRLMAIAENNLAFLKVCAHELDGAVSHLHNAWSLFDQLGDQVRRAQVDDTTARLHLAEGRFTLADEAAGRSVATLEGGDEDALLAEALTTKASVYVKLERYSEAKRLFEMAHGVALRCGDREGSGRALLIMLEEMLAHLTSEERNDTAERVHRLLSNSQQPSIRRRVATAVQS